MELIEQNDETTTRRVTRRTLVRTGAKLVYAAPVVAATYTLSADGALAVTCPRRFAFDASGPFGPGCYNCNIGRDFDCRRFTNPFERRDCLRAQVACRRAHVYNAATDRCETRRGVPGGANCGPAFSPAVTP